MGERFKIPQVQAEIARLVRSHPRAVIDVPEALHFLLGNQLETSAIPALKVSRFPVQHLSVWLNGPCLAVARAVGPCATCDSGDLLPTPLQQQPSGLAVCHEGFGAIPRRLDVLLRASSGSSTSFGRSR